MAFAMREAQRIQAEADDDGMICGTPEPLSDLDDELLPDTEEDAVAAAVQKIEGLLQL